MLREGTLMQTLTSSFLDFFQRVAKVDHGTVVGCRQQPLVINFGYLCQGRPAVVPSVPARQTRKATVARHFIWMRRRAGFITSVYP